MRNNRNLTSVLSVLLLVGIGAGCENASQIAGPAEDAPQFSRTSTTSTPVDWNMGAFSQTVTEMLPSGGGVLEIRSGADPIVRLVVPGGASRGLPVTYAMTLTCVENAPCSIELTAHSWTRPITHFHKSVQLEINLNYLTPGYDSSTLRIAQDHGDSYTSMPSRIEGNFLIATLNHFSAYVPITD